MKNRIVIIAAIALGLLAAAINWAYVSSVRGSGMTVLRVKEGKRIPAGQKVTVDFFEPVTLYGDVAQLRRLAVASSEIGSFKDNPVTSPLEPGDLLLLTSFQLRGDAGLRREIGQGERAITVSVVDESKAVAFFVRPGDVVDVWGVIAERSYLLKDHAKVAAVGDVYQLAGEGSASDGQKKYRSVTLVVSAIDVEALVHNVAAAGNKVTLALIGEADAGAPAGPALEPVFAKPPPAATKPAAQPVPATVKPVTPPTVVPPAPAAGGQ